MFNGGIGKGYDWYRMRFHKDLQRLKWKDSKFFWPVTNLFQNLTRSIPDPAWTRTNFAPKSYLFRKWKKLNALLQALEFFVYPTVRWINLQNWHALKWPNKIRETYLRTWIINRLYDIYLVKILSLNKWNLVQGNELNLQFKELMNLSSTCMMEEILFSFQPKHLNSYHLRIFAPAYRHYGSRFVWITMGSVYDVDVHFVILSNRRTLFYQT